MKSARVLLAVFVCGQIICAVLPGDAQGARRYYAQGPGAWIIKEENIRPADYESIRVEMVVSGDIIRLGNGQFVRLIGIDTPETESTTRMISDARIHGIHPSILQAMGNEAAAWARRLIEGKNVRIEFDEQKIDVNGMLLGYVFLRNEERTFVNAEIIKRGYAKLTVGAPNVKYRDLFQKLHEESLKNARGLWEQWISR